MQHEALLRVWARLREWLSVSRGDVRLRRQLAAAADDWRLANRDNSFLLIGSRLAQFESWAVGTDLVLTQDEHEFLDASLAGRKTQQEAEATRQQGELEAAHGPRYTVWLKNTCVPWVREHSVTTTVWRRT